MSHELRSTRAADAAPGAEAPSSSTAPGRRSAADELYAGADAAAGRGASAPLFAGGADWEELDVEDPMALEVALQPSADEDAGATPADEEGELDPEEEAAAAEEEELEASLEDAQALSAAEPQRDAPAPGAEADAAPRAPAGGQTQAPARATAASTRGGQPRARAAGASKTYRVNRAYRDGPYGGTAKYDVRVTAKDITISVGIRLKPSRGVTAAQIKQTKEDSQAAFKQKFDRRFKLTEVPYKPRPLKMQLRFSSASAHHNVALHKGGGRDNAANWYVTSDPTTRAHEIGHLLGLLDEYADSTSPKRKVHTDNSLMGNYPSEGVKTASLKKRHGKVFAGDISRASGRKFYLSS